MAEINLCIVGVGNCASSLVQGIHYYRFAKPDEPVGLMHWEIGGYLPGDLRVVAAFDVDRRKVGADVAEAIFAEPNCTAVFCADVPPAGVQVRMGPVLDGVAPHMHEFPASQSFVVADAIEPGRDEVVELLRATRTHVLVNYLPVGSEAAVRFYAECALEAGVALVNCMPVFIASDPRWAQRFAERGLPIIGDDIKAQLGATITHRTLTDLFRMRGVKLDRTYQLNTGGNTDFLNMLERSRLSSKRISKTEAVQSVAGRRLAADDIHIGPSDYVAWQKDNKVCFVRLQWRGFGDVAMNLELRLSVEDSPNSAGVAIDAIRAAKLAADRGDGGPLHAISAFAMKHPPVQLRDVDALRGLEEWLSA